MAINAYRNYNTNTSALSKNLEKLSSGYKINRADDAAAGLAISEKMCAQITGLNAAQKNVKDGISLVKTAESAPCRRSRTCSTAWTTWPPSPLTAPMTTRWTARTSRKRSTSSSPKSTVSPTAPTSTASSSWTASWA